MAKIKDQSANVEMAKILILKKPITEENLEHLTQLFGHLSHTIGNRNYEKVLLEEVLEDCKAELSGAVSMPKHVATLSSFVMDRIHKIDILDNQIYVARAIATTGAECETELEARATGFWKDKLPLLGYIYTEHGSMKVAHTTTDERKIHSVSTNLFLSKVSSCESLGNKITFYDDAARAETFSGREGTVLCVKSIEGWTKAVREVSDYVERALFGHMVWKTVPEGTKFHEAGVKLMKENGLDPQNPNPRYFRGLVQTLER
jgi:excinuclease UvrABC ATPase subunit